MVVRYPVRTMSWVYPRIPSVPCDVAYLLTSLAVFLHTRFLLRLTILWALACPENQIDALAARTGRWIFRGYVHAGDFWVGRWRGTSTLVAPMGFEGGFTLVRDW